jgi:GDPmannose 4,6-dehydratase
LRPHRFVTRKIVAAACRIAQGSTEKLVLGNLTIRRDWGWAPEYVEAMWKMLQSDSPQDFIIATGVSHSLEQFAHQAFSELDLDWRDHTIQSESLLRPTDIAEGKGDASKAARVLGWQAKAHMATVVSRMIRAELKLDAEPGP